MNKLTDFLGRVMFGLPFTYFGIENITEAKMYMGVGAVPGFIPGGIIWFYFIGIAMILLPLAIITGWQGRNATFGLAITILIFILNFHLPWLLVNYQAKLHAWTHCLQYFSLMGAALVIAGTFKNKRT